MSVKVFWQLSKPRIAFLVAITTAISFWLAGGRDMWLFGATILGATLAACSTGCLNQLFEMDVDAKMTRTRNRPLPSGRATPMQALIFGELCAFAGLFILFSTVHWLAGALAAVTIALYLFAYTPLKRTTPLSTWFGAVAGAMPPLIGWAAATGSLAPLAWVLFGIQFLWQIPHFLAMFWIYREDYARAGFKVMPVIDKSGGATAVQIAIHSFAVLPVSLIPSYFGVTGLTYTLGALFLGTAYMGLGMRASWTMTIVDARRLFFASLLYLPLVFVLLVFLGGFG